MKNGNAPDSKYLHLLNDVQLRPIFIIGDHRSGTTLLHRLLAQTGCFNYVNTYHVVRYNEVLTHHIEGQTASAKKELLDEFLKLGVKDRTIDKTPATPDSPVEYGFIFASAANVRRAQLAERTLPIFMELARKIQYVSDPSKPLLLKNPWDVLTFANIGRFVAGAKLIFIHRHPAAVVNSQMQAVRSLLERRNEFAAKLAPWYSRLFDHPLQLFIARSMDTPPLYLWERLLGLHQVRLANYYLQNIGGLAKSDFMSLKYEQLCQAPDECMDRIFQFSGVSPANSGSYKEMIEPRAPRIGEDIRRAYRRVASKLLAYLNYHGYEREPDWLLKPR